MWFGEMTVTRLRSVLSIPGLLRVFIVNVFLLFFLFVYFELWFFSFRLLQ